MSEQPEQPEQSEHIIPINGMLVDDEGNSSYFFPGSLAQLTAEDIKKVVQGQKLDDETVVVRKQPERTLEEKQRDIRTFAVFLVQRVKGKTETEAQQVADLAVETMAMEHVAAANEWAKTLALAQGYAQEDAQAIFSIIEDAQLARFQGGVGTVADLAHEIALEGKYADSADDISRIAAKAAYLVTANFFDKALELALAKAKTAGLSKDDAQNRALLATEARALVDVADIALQIAHEMGETTDTINSIADIAAKTKALEEENITLLWKTKAGRVRAEHVLFDQARTLAMQQSVSAIRASDSARIATKAVMLSLEQADVYQAALALALAKSEPGEKAYQFAKEEASTFVANVINRSLEELRLKEGSGVHYATVEGVDSNNMAEAGWGIIFADSDKESVERIKQALKPLLDFRRTQAGGTYEGGGLYREFTGSDAYFPRDDKRTFLDRHSIGFGPVDPRKGVPYYLLIVASPETIPYEFQTELDVQFAVGRIWFADAQGKPDLEAYKRYAHSVVYSEQEKLPGKLPIPRSATFFGVRTKGDAATELSAEHLIKPLAEKLSADQPDWDIQTIVDQDATKANLKHVLGGEKTSAFVFTASHGMCFPNNHSKQFPHQGALLCQDWPGPGNRVARDHYFAAEDIDDDAKLMGMIAFFFACFGAGTPELDDFAKQAFKDRPDAIAPKSFLSSLPMRMLSHPNGGALAVVGHVERAWGYSFLLGDKQQQLQTFQSTLKALFDGKRLGYAFEYFNVRHAEISVSLAGMMQRIETQSKTVVAELWTTNNDARNYVILGDPAVKLPVDA